MIVGFVFDGDGGGQHHQTSSRLTLEAFRAAADPAKFPEQIKEGLRPWQPKKFYYTAGFGPGGVRPPSQPAAASAGQAVEAPTMVNFAGGAVFDPVLGRTYDEIAGEARSMHKCQGMSQLLPLPASTGGGGFGGGGPGGVRNYRLRDTVLDGGVARTEKEIFDGVDTSLRSLLAFAPGAPAELGAGLDRITAAVADARKALSASGEAATVAPLTAGLKALRDVRASLASMNLADNARYEIDFRLAQEGTAVRASVDAGDGCASRRGRARRPGRCRPAAAGRLDGGQSRQEQRGDDSRRERLWRGAGRDVQGFAARSHRAHRATAGRR